MGKIISYAALVLIFTCSCSFAGYGDNVSLKADRGFSNVLGCWLEVPYHTYTMAKEKGVLRGAPLGFGKGVMMTPLRLFSGGVDIVTFPFPCPQRGWKGLMDPQYNPWVGEPEPAPAPAPEPVQVK